MADEKQPQAKLFAALAKFQAELPKIAKDASARIEPEDRSKRAYSYKYADLADVAEVVEPLIGKYGLAFTAKPTMIDGQFVLDYKLVHESGEYDRGFYPLPDPRTTKPQTVGSMITYARRYTLCASTGVAPNGDDDDAGTAQADFLSAGEAFANASPTRPLPADSPWRRRVDDVQVIAAAAVLLEELRQLVINGDMSRDHGDQVKALLDARVEQIRAQKPDSQPQQPQPAPQEPQEPPAAPANPAPENEWVTRFRESLDRAKVPEDLDGKRGEIGRAVVDGHITSNMTPGLAKELTARRRQLEQQHEPAGASA